MKIVNKETMFGGNTTEFKFDNGAWVSIYNGGLTGEGSWEFQHDEDVVASYCSGGLWFEGNVIEDYDGCFWLPAEVKCAIKELGYTLND